MQPPVQVQQVRATQAVQVLLLAVAVAVVLAQTVATAYQTSEALEVQVLPQRLQAHQLPSLAVVVVVD
jgi:hypothetical protein